MKKKLWFPLTAVLIIILVLAAFLRQNREDSSSDPISETGYYLNTVITITLYDTTDSDLLKGAFSLCSQYEQQFSRTIETSEISKINSGELFDENGIAHLSADTADLIREALYYAELSGGAFDPTIEPVSSLWDFTSGSEIVPSDEEITAALSLVDYTKVHLDGQDLTFDTEGMGLDLGAIAKGYIADRIKDYLEENGVTQAIINLGGNVLCIGSKPDGSDFNVGVQDPFNDRNEVLLTVPVSDRSVVTSGTYERSFEKDGVLYHHILDPSTGYPYSNGLTAVTILSDTSVEGDGLSTTCFALGLEDGMALIEDTDNVEAVFVTEDGEIHYSSGFPEADVK